ncbi:MAG: FAD-binding oxidoreductase [Chloroflexota bacterium]
MADAVAQAERSGTLRADVPFETLGPRLRGGLLLPDDPGYDDARALWNAMFDRRPAAIARPLGVADVVEAVRFGREHGLPIAVKGGGHNIAGLAIADGSLLLDMSRMRGVVVDPAERTAIAQAGCLLGDVDRETQVHGLATVLGFVSSTGIAGLTLGGGFGYLTRRFGWTSDNVLELQAVTADGSVVRASERENPDLFWAMRGGGGNFGVATSFRYRLHELGPEILGGPVAWTADDAPAVLDTYQALIADAPPELNVVAIYRPAPPAPWIPQEHHFKPILVLMICDTGPVDEAEARVRALRSVGKPIGSALARRPYLALQSLLDATQPKGRRYYWKSEYLPTVEPDVLSYVADRLPTFPSPHSGIIVFPIHGAHQRLPDDHSAVGNRNAGAVLNIGASWERAEDDEQNIDWARETWRGARGFSTGGAYINFLTEEEGEDRIRACYGGNLERLARVKAAWDPDNLFRLNKNIAPS